MIRKMLKKDMQCNKAITITLCAFIMLAALLIASASGIIMELFQSMDNLFEISSVPHFVQMHSDEIDQQQIDDFVIGNELVKEQQTTEMINISGSSIYLGDSLTSEVESVVDISFIKQNLLFDFLVDLENNVVRPASGEIGVPIYFMEQNNLRIGDTVKIISGDFEMDFVITAFIRDAQMNPSLVTSKRFVINDADWEILKENMGESEYLIEFQLYDLANMKEFEAAYQDSGLPQTDTTITYSLFKVLNALTDGIVAAVIILISLLLIGIALLCLRYTLIAAIEEDYREIGVMKAIGLSSVDIRKIYMTKYLAMAGASSICGYALSLWIGKIFTANITLYMGTGKKTPGNYLVPFAAVIIVFSIVVSFCRFILRKFRHISTVEALRSGSSPDKAGHHHGFVIHKSRFSNINIYLGIKDVFTRFNSYLILCIVFVICTFLAVVPTNLLTTLQSRDFITYMGAGESDIRIDLQKSKNMEERYNEMLSIIENDDDIEKYTVLVTSTFQVLNNEGTYSNLKIETGDFSVFPLSYLSGAAPTNSGEISLSSMNADELEKAVGDTLELLVNDVKLELTVCGIYQDVTNGGKTAKAILPVEHDDILWYVVNLDVKDGVNIAEKKLEYSNMFQPAKVLEMDEYLSQTLGSITGQLKFASITAVTIAIVIVILITTMYFKMALAKDASQIAIMRSIGFSTKDVEIQYITRSLLVLVIGITVGTLTAGSLGQGLVGGLMSLMGASHITFVVNPLLSYTLYPGILILTVTITTLLCSRSIKHMNNILPR